MKSWRQIKFKEILNNFHVEERRSRLIAESTAANQGQPLWQWFEASRSLRQEVYRRRSHAYKWAVWMNETCKTVANCICSTPVIAIRLKLIRNSQTRVRNISTIISHLWNGCVSEKLPIVVSFVQSCRKACKVHTTYWYKILNDSQAAYRAYDSPAQCVPVRMLIVRIEWETSVIGLLQKSTSNEYH